MTLEYAEVILDVSCDKTLDYRIPQTLKSHVKKGNRVSVPVRGHLRKGYVVKLKSQSTFPQLQNIDKVLSPQVLLNDELFDLCRWMASYYCCSLQKVLKCLVPSSIRKDIKSKKQYVVKRAKSKKVLVQACLDFRQSHPKQVLVLEHMLRVGKNIFLTELLEKTGVSRHVVHSLEEKELLSLEKLIVDRSPLLDYERFPSKPKSLNPQQAKCLDSISQTLASSSFCTHLLYGVTGSGKTEVYLQGIQKALEQGKSVLVLVPEIALTTQTIERFKSRLDTPMAILHHRLSDGERYDQWMKILKGEIKLVIGARSAVFSPLQNLGLIIVDEEHEKSYKQSEESPCYNARDIAVMRAKLQNCCVVLGSATPSLESFYNAQRGRYTLNTLNIRADNASHAEVEIIDMKQEFEKNQGFTLFSQQLLRELKNNHLQGNQSLLFLNRRGYHSLLMCQACSHVIQCPHCDVSLTFHKGENILSCHQCNYTLSPPPKSCPSCKQGTNMKFKGYGTEQVERSLKAIFPELRLLRMDADTTRHKGAHEKLIRAFKTHKADVLIGTQMIAKGLHFPHVTLACVLHCDSSLHIPDFRASENTFQLLCQLAGRAGRGKLKGKVLFQTFLPQSPILNLAASQDYEAFYKEEIAIRQDFHYPPFSHMIKLTFQGEEALPILNEANRIKQRLLELLPSSFHIHPVIPAGHAKIKDKFRFHCLIRGPHIGLANQKIQQILAEKKLPSAIRCLVDIHPQTTFF